MRKPLDASEVRAQFDYDPETGILTRKFLRAANLRPETGTMNREGYLVVGINNGHEMAHRLAWAHVHGDWPSKQLEHINGDKADNRIANLRLRNPAPKQDLTLERLKEVLRYEPETGKLCWLQTTRWTRAGEEAGSIRTIGYRAIMIDGVSHYAHRLAWLYVHGEWPKRHIDHLNGNRADNRIANLRDVSPSENYHNTTKLGPNNTTGYRGVARYADKYVSQIMIEGKLTAISMRDNPQDAHADYVAKHIEIFGAPPTNESTIVYPKSRKRKGAN